MPFLVIHIKPLVPILGATCTWRTKLNSVSSPLIYSTLLLTELLTNKKLQKVLCTHFTFTANQNKISNILQKLTMDL